MDIEGKKTSALLHSILILLMITPLFYIRNTYQPFSQAKFFLISLGLLSLSIYIMVNRIDIKIPKFFVPSFIVFSPFLIRWIFTPFPLFSLFFTLFFFFYLIFLLLLYNINQKFHINKNVLVWIWIGVTQIFAFLVIVERFKFPVIYPFLKKVTGIFWTKSSILGGNPNYSSEFLAFSFMAFMITFFHKKIEFKFFSKFVLDIILKLIVLLVLFFTLIILSSRASISALGIGFLLFSILVIRKNKTYLVIFLLFLFITLSVFTIPSLRSYLPDKLQNITNMNKILGDIQYRIFYWKVAWEMGKESPIFGKGPGMFRAELPDIALRLKKKTGLKLKDYLYTKSFNPRIPPNAHNEWLEFWAEGGVLLFLYFIFFFYIYWSFLKRFSIWDRMTVLIPLLVLSLNAIFAFPFHIPLIFPFFSIYIFIVDKYEKDLGSKFKIIKVKWMRYLVFIISIIFYFININYLLSDQYLLYGMTKKSIPSLEKSAKLNSINHYSWQGLYNFSVKQKLSIDKKIYYAKHYLELTGAPMFEYYLGELLAKKGQYQEAIKRVKKAIALVEGEGYENIYKWYHRLSYYYYLVKDFKKAVESEKKALKTNKDNKALEIEAYSNLSNYYYRLRDYKSSFEAAKEALSIIDKLPLEQRIRYNGKYEELSDFIKTLKKKL